MKDRETQEFIEYCNTLGSIPGLDSITELTKRLGNPQDSLKFIHIAGTNGKGSVLAFISTTLSLAGYKVGRYLSPTIFEYRERFQINGKMIAKSKLNRYMERLKTVCEDMVRAGYPHPTSFEVETALAFLYFWDEKCDVVVLETGMGGTLDATNLIQTTMVSVITSISMDHMQYLGDTLGKIAKQKAGVIKNDVDTVTCAQEEEVLHVLKEVCGKKRSQLYTASVKDASHIRYGIRQQSFVFEKETYKMTLAGTYQIENAVLAVKVLKLMQEKNLLPYHGRSRLTDTVIKEGIFHTQWKGRFSVVEKKPLFIVDGAHNEAASIQLAKSMEFYFTNKRKIYIMGMFRDKECEKVVRNTVPAASQVITVTTPFNNRALDALELAQIVKEYNPNVTVADSLEEAVEIGSLFADEDSVILAFGSLSYLGDIIRIVENHNIIRSDTHGK